MPKKIFKYELSPNTTQNIPMPKGAEILCIQNQRETPCIWALCDFEEGKYNRTIELVATGELMPNENRNYIGSIQMAMGSLVFHCFEIIE